MKIDTPIPPEFFSPSRQFLCTLVYDWHRVGRDLFKVLIILPIGFALHRASPSFRRDSFLCTIFPLLLISIPIYVLSFRLCKLEVTRPTRAFYDNLPRSRKITWLAHLALISATALLLDAELAIAAALHLITGPNYSPYPLSAGMFLIPFLTLAIAYWVIYTTYTIALIPLVIYIIFWASLEACGHQWMIFPITITIILCMLGFSFVEWSYPLKDIDQ